MTGVQTCALPICFPVTILERLKNNENLFLPETQKEEVACFIIIHILISEAQFGGFVNWKFVEKNLFIVTNTHFRKCRECFINMQQIWIKCKRNLI